LRIEYENATDQVLAHGNRREAIFRDYRDRTEFRKRHARHLLKLVAA